jgi:hypothetical protein
MATFGYGGFNRMRQNSKCLLVLAVIILVVGATVSNATPIYDTSAMDELTGSRSVDPANGLVFGSGDATRNDATLSWDIDRVGNLFHYSYAFSYESKQGLSHFLLDISDDCIDDWTSCLANVVINGSWNPQPGIFTGTDQGNSNPNFPGSIAGIKFNTLGMGGHTTFYLDFDSPRVPVYGDFYAKGGKGDKGNGFSIYNAGAANHLSENVIDFVARPDTEFIANPEPGSLILLGTGIAGLVLTYRRRKKN